MPLGLGFFAAAGGLAANLKRILTTKASGTVSTGSWSAGSANRDSSGNVASILLGLSQSSRSSLFINRYNAAGNNVGKYIISGSNDLLGANVYSTNVDTALSSYGSFFNGTDFYYSIVKADTNGNKIYERYIRFTINDFGQPVTADSSGNAYLLIGNRNNSSNFPLIWKVDTNGNSSWQRLSQSYNFGIDGGRPVAIDTNGTRVNFACDMSSGATRYAVFGKIDADGTNFVHGYTPANYRAFAITTIDNNFWAGNGGRPDLIDTIFVTKGSQTSNSYSWTRLISASSIQQSNARTGADSAGAIYVVFAAGTTTPICVIIKFDASGNTVWQRQIRYSGNLGTGVSSTATVIREYDTNNMLLSISTGSSGGYAASFNYLIPKDGSLTGTYASTSPTSVTFTTIYEAGSFTISNDTVSPNAIGATVETGSNQVGSTTLYTVASTTNFDHVNNF